MNPDDTGFAANDMERNRWPTIMKKKASATWNTQSAMRSPGLDDAIDEMELG